MILLFTWHRKRRKIFPSVTVLEALARCYGRPPLEVFEVALNMNKGTKEDSDVLFETIIYNNDFIINGKIAEKDVKDAIVDNFNLIGAVENQLLVIRRYFRLKDDRSLGVKADREIGNENQGKILIGEKEEVLNRIILEMREQLHYYLPAY